MMLIYYQTQIYFVVLMTKINYEHYEVLVTDDGSTDSTPEILARLQKKYPKLVSPIRLTE